MTALWAALLLAQQHADSITKSGKNTSQGWQFVTVEEVTRVAREALNAAGLVAVLRLPADAPYDAQHLDAYLELTHPNSGEQARFPVPWPVERPGPQARRAAYAYARKQALLELLALAEADDPEATSGIAGTPQPAQKSRPTRTVRRTDRPAVAARPPEPPLDPAESQQDGPNPQVEGEPTPQAFRALHAAYSAAGIDRDERLEHARTIIGRDIETSRDLTADEVAKLLDRLNAPTVDR